MQTPKFHSEEVAREQETLEQLKEAGGILFRQETNAETRETTNFVNVLGVEVETYASEEDIESIKKEIELSEVDQDILRTIAYCYKHHVALILESDPGGGKTFLPEKFIKLIHGKDYPVLKLVGTPRTSELEIMGHWAPAGSNRDSNDPTIIRYNAIEKEYQTVNDEFDERYKKNRENLRSGQITEKDAQIDLDKLYQWHKPLEERYAKELQILIAQTSQKVEWEFKEGALLQCYAGRGGDGCPLIFDELNLVPSNQQQNLIKIGGEKGIMSDAVDWFGNGDKTIYPRGKNAWLCCTINFPEKTAGRNEVVAPLMDRVLLKVISAEEYKKKRDIMRRTACGLLKKRSAEMNVLSRIEVPVKNGIDWCNVLDGQLGENIADIISLLDEDFAKAYEQVGDKISIKGKEINRNQPMEFTPRNLSRVYSYLSNSQVRDEKTGLVDFTRTILNAFDMFYVNRLASDDVRGKARGLADQIVNGDTGKIKFEGALKTRKEILDILSERASMSLGGNKGIEGQEERETKQAKYAAEDALASLLDNPNIPQFIKEELKK